MEEILLEIRDLTKEFGGLRALDRVNFEVHRGEIVGLIGPNGAGKTTLINLCTGFLRPSAGRVLFRGQTGHEYDLTRLSAHKIAKIGIRRTFQKGTVFEELTVLENILVSLSSRYPGSIVGDFFASKAAKEMEFLRIRKGEQMLELIRLSSFRDDFCSSLPIGYQRALSVCSALCSEPEILLLDEPSAGLSISEARSLCDLLTRVNHEQEIGILVISHEMEFVMGLSHKIVVLDFGKKIAEGIPEEVRDNSMVVEAYLGGGNSDADC
jgi:ABC-type branched-subunit amino acid transport system ATPase component